MNTFLLIEKKVFFPHKSQANLDIVMIRLSGIASKLHFCQLKLIITSISLKICTVNPINTLTAQAYFVQFNDTETLLQVNPNTTYYCFQENLCNLICVIYI